LIAKNFAAGGPFWIASMARCAFFSAVLLSVFALFQTDGSPWPLPWVRSLLFQSFFLLSGQCGVPLAVVQSSLTVRPVRSAERSFPSMEREIMVIERMPINPAIKYMLEFLHEQTRRTQAF
jgi:hypothetical protein